MKKGKFIVLEGVDGSGKSTQSARLLAKIQSTGQAVTATYEPTSGPIGSVLRNILQRRIKADEKTIAAMFLADRLDHIQNDVNGMLKTLEKGTHIICDRYYFSSYAYHSTHMPMQWVIDCNSICAELLRPDLTVYIDITPEESMKRLQKGRASLDLFESFERISNVRQNYLMAIEQLEKEEEVKVINGQRDPDAVFSEIWESVQQLLA